VLVKVSVKSAEYVPGAVVFGTLVSRNFMAWIMSPVDSTVPVLTGPLATERFDPLAAKVRPAVVLAVPVGKPVVPGIWREI
jgi:hypothetical protein